MAFILLSLPNEYYINMNEAVQTEIAETIKECMMATWSSSSISSWYDKLDQWKTRTQTLAFGFSMNGDEKSNSVAVATLHLYMLQPLVPPTFPALTRLDTLLKANGLTSQMVLHVTFGFPRLTLNTVR